MNRQQRSILEVPFSEKDEAKRLGAWWDPQLRKWFVPAGKDLHPFKKWLPHSASECQKGHLSSQESPLD